ncbi:MAG TPA: hypothetical protein PK156_23475 [Polyangium sp.]|nr:hypothetical protein [Polyangium sp.]
MSRSRAAASETAELARHGDGLIRRLTKSLRILFGSKYERLLRVLPPMIQRAFVPESSEFSQLGPKMRYAHRSPWNTVEHNDVRVHLFTLGKADEAAKLEKDLTSWLFTKTNVSNDGQDKPGA